jgi:2-polyprenyl-3-methyl-5-hydroxy-6-metoxy-1,4-benzoquinol methylase
LSRAYRPLARQVAATKYRRKYGGRFVSKIDAGDDLLHYSIEGASEVHSSFRYFRGVQWYFNGGEWNAAEVEDVLRYAGHSLHDAGSVLEFACGYGRVTRHLVRRISPSRITVSDIDRAAVDFVKARFGVDGFYSASTPEQLVHDRRYDVIVVVSFFSHLPEDSWGPWLRRLHGMLEPDGLLLFTTLPLDAGGGEVAEADREGFQRGFLFHVQNETRGRLDSEQYGTASVSPEYVEQAAAANFDGRLLKHCPREFNGVQDAYVLQRAA